MRPAIFPSKVRRVFPTSPHPLAPPELTVVIVNYNGWRDVSGLVSALAAEPEVRDGLCEIVVVDNASDGPIPGEFRRERPGVRLIRRDENGGFAAGVNAGWRSSRSPWLLLLNPDVEVAAGLIARILLRLEGYRTHPEGPPAVVGFGLRNADGSRQPSVGVEPGLLRSLWGQFLPRSRRKYQADWRIRPGEVPWVTGACALVHADLMHSLSGMDENYFLYYEEVALCRSARNLGRRVEYDPAVEVVHLRPLQDRPITPRMRVITRHSKLLYFRQHRPSWEFSLLARLVTTEARLRAGIARWRNDPDDSAAWNLIEKVARAMRQGRSLSGLEVMKQTRRVHEPHHPPRPTIKPAARPKSSTEGRR